MRMFKRTVVRASSTKQEVVDLYKELEQKGTDMSTYSIEFTPVWNAYKRWRLITITPVKADTPDQHPTTQGQHGYRSGGFDWW